MKKKIKARRDLEKSTAELAAKYAKSKDWKAAARWYQAAAFHRAVAEELAQS